MARVLVLRAGSAASNNLIRSLKAGDPSLFVVGCHDDRFALKTAPADCKYMVPVVHHRLFAKALCQIIKAERIDLVIPNTDFDVAMISDLRDRLPCRTFLPRRSVITRCQDKYALAKFLRRCGLPTPLTYPVNALDEVEKVFDRFPSSSMLWCRIRKGTGSSGAIPVKSPEQAKAWIRYWEEMREVKPGSFTLSEYLPGRDVTVQCLLKSGTLLMSKMHERLSYHVSGGGPSGVSSTAALAKIIWEPDVMNVGMTALAALDKKASGIFFIDFKENADGEFCITEINAGRFANIPTIHDIKGQTSMSVAYVRASLGQPLETNARNQYGEDWYVLRGLDGPPGVFQASELFDGIEDWKRLTNVRHAGKRMTKSSQWQ